MTPKPTPDEERLTDSQIEAILEQEAAGLPPESHESPKPVPLVAREPGEGRIGRWAVWLLILFILASLVQSMR